MQIKLEEKDNTIEALKTNLINAETRLIDEKQNKTKILNLPCNLEETYQKSQNDIQDNEKEKEIEKEKDKDNSEENLIENLKKNYDDLLLKLEQKENTNESLQTNLINAEKELISEKEKYNKIIGLYTNLDEAYKKSQEDFNTLKHETESKSKNAEVAVEVRQVKVVDGTDKIGDDLQPQQLLQSKLEQKDNTNEMLKTNMRKLV